MDQACTLFHLAGFVRAISDHCMFAVLSMYVFEAKSLGSMYTLNVLWLSESTPYNKNVKLLSSSLEWPR